MVNVELDNQHGHSLLDLGIMASDPIHCFWHIFHDEIQIHIVFLESFRQHKCEPKKCKSGVKKKMKEKENEREKKKRDI